MRFLVLLLIWVLPNAAQGKQQVTGTSAPGSLHLEAKPAFPAYIRVLSKSFNEPSGNRALDAEETGRLVVRVKNEGLGKGKLSVKLTPLTGTEGLSFRRTLNVGEVDVDESRTIQIPIRADFEVETMRRDFRVEIVEGYYKDVIPFTFRFDTKAYDPPEFRVILKDYDDSREIMKRNNPDGSVEAGEVIRVTANVQNIGVGEAEQVRAKVTIEDAGGKVHYRRDLQGSMENTFGLGKMASGADRDVPFYFFTNPTCRDKKVNITVDVTEARGRHGTSKAFSFDIGQSVPTEEVLAVRSVQERRKGVSLVQPQLVDVDQVPSGSKTKLENGIAIIFGIETYKHTFPAAYKNRDATVFYKYCKDVLGIPEERIYLSTDDDATKGEFDYVFEPKHTLREGWLKKRMKDPQQARETDIFVYLGGHGFPDLSTGKPYFIPYDIRPEQATNGVSMEVLYQRLSEFNARRVLVFVESCFSGASGYRKGMKEELYKERNMRYALYSILTLAFMGCAGRMMERPEVLPPPSQPMLEEPSVQDLDEGWIEAVGDAYLINITPEEAKRQALENARAEAVRYAVGVQVGSAILDQQSSIYDSAKDREMVRESFASICEQTSAGKIIEEKPPRWRTYTVTDPKSALPITVYRAYLRAKVAEEEGHVDPDFTVRVELNQDRFRDGDEMTMRLRASKDCYLTVLNLASNDTVYVLLPHEYRKDNFIAGGQTVEVPDAEERAIGIHYRVRLLEGQDAATEVIKVIATKRRYAFGKGLERVGGFPIVPTPRGALVELQRWLVRIPRDERAEVMSVYEIRR